jgi:hypothetical protein
MDPVQSEPPDDDAAWVRRVNGRWIVHHGLKDSSDAYLTRLESVDPDRFARSCERARLLVRKCPPGEDPKPWFYAGLFSLVTPSEASQFLADHWFTAQCIPGLAKGLGADIRPEGIGLETEAKAQRIRDALGALDAPCQ